jgi:hypothetical protein
MQRRRAAGFKVNVTPTAIVEVIDVATNRTLRRARLHRVVVRLLFEQHAIREPIFREMG